MKQLAMIVVLCAGPLAADPLDLIDYAGVFDTNPTDVEDVSEARSIMRLTDITLLRDENLPRGFSGIGKRGVGAVDCYVTILPSAESAMRACESEIPADQLALQNDYLMQALTLDGATEIAGMLSTSCLPAANPCL